MWVKPTYDLRFRRTWPDWPERLVNLDRCDALVIEGRGRIGTSGIGESTYAHWVLIAYPQEAPLAVVATLEEARGLLARVWEEMERGAAMLDLGEP
jgi:hypothetical protein